MNKKIHLVHSDEYENWVFDKTHPTQGRRFTNARNLLRAASDRGEFELIEVEPRLATPQELGRVHAQGYIHDVLDHHVTSEWQGERPDLSYLAQLFVGGTLTALELLLSGEANLAVNLPGAKHHAQYDHASGFCVFNDFAIAADVAGMDHGKKVLIIDIDGHHGDGTENLMCENSRVITCSVHQMGIFPGTGWACTTAISTTFLWKRVREMTDSSRVSITSFVNSSTCVGISGGSQTSFSWRLGRMDMRRIHSLA